MRAQRSFLLPLLLVFIICDGLFISGKNMLAKWGIDNAVLIIANSVFLVLALLTFLLQQKALKNSNPNVFVRSVMAGMMIKMAVCIAAVIVYWFLRKDSFSKSSVFAAMLIYIIYLAVEVSLITKLNRKKNA